MKAFLVLFALFFTCNRSWAEEKVTKVGNKKVIYTYKQYEKFDFDELDIEGDGDMQNDLSIPPIHEKRFANRLPYRKSFTVEIKKGIERVR